jgi:uncharacterized protein
MFFGGFYLQSPPLVVSACLYMAGLVAFSVITLPVELGASRRALLLLQRTGLARDGELDEIRDVLRAAGLTHVAGIAQQLGVFLAMLVIAATVFGLHVP